MNLEMPNKPTNNPLRAAMTASEIALVLGSNQKRITYEIGHALAKFKAELEKRGFKMKDLLDVEDIS